MTGERMYPFFPCPDLDEAVEFYVAPGFRCTFHQLRPYPCAVVELDDLGVHLSGIDGFDPAGSVSGAVVVVPDAEALHASFAEGLRARYGRLPVSGVPRLLRPRRKQGTATGFSLVDTGGCWLRFYREGEAEDLPEHRSEGLERAVEVAARQGTPAAREVSRWPSSRRRWPVTPRRRPSPGSAHSCTAPSCWSGSDARTRRRAPSRRPTRWT